MYETTVRIVASYISHLGFPGYVTLLLKRMLTGLRNLRTTKLAHGNLRTETCARKLAHDETYARKLAHNETCALQDAHVQLAHGSFAHEIKILTN